MTQQATMQFTRKKGRTIWNGLLIKSKAPAYTCIESPSAKKTLKRCYSIENAATKFTNKPLVQPQCERQQNISKKAENCSSQWWMETKKKKKIRIIEKGMFLTSQRKKLVVWCRIDLMNTQTPMYIWKQSD